MRNIRGGIRSSKRYIPVSTIPYAFYFIVKCGDESHTVSYKPGYPLEFIHHAEANDPAVAKAMMSLGADTPACFVFMRAVQEDNLLCVKYGRDKCTEIVAFSHENSELTYPIRIPETV